MTRLAVFGDNGIGRWFAQMFDTCPDVCFFVSEQNKSGLNITDRHKYLLSNKRNLRLAMRRPWAAFQRLAENGFDNKLDFHYFELDQAVASQAFDVALTKSERSLYSLAALKERYRNFKLVYWVPFTIPYVDAFDERSFLIRRRAWDSVDLFVAITETCRDTLLFEGVDPKRIVQAYPGIDLAQFRPRDRRAARLATGLAPDCFHLLYVGKLVSWKGCYTLLYAVRALREAIPEIRLTLLGSGAQLGNLRRMIGLLGLESCVELRGHVPYADIPQYYAAADLFVLPALPAINLAEQFGYVVAEAMACGTPAVVSRVGGLPETVGHRGELLFTPGDFRELALRIHALYTNPALAHELSRYVLDHAQRHYDATANGPQIIDSIAEL
jgi:glycosyltransferase involved in cell wall biosynthesis